MLLGLSTVCAVALNYAPDRLLDLVARCQADAIALDGGLPADVLDALLPVLRQRSRELPVWLVECPCPAGPRNRAALGSRDRAEAAVAQQAARETLELAAELGAGCVALKLGEVTALQAAWPRARRALLRGSLDGEPLAQLQQERALRGLDHLDDLRRALDQLGRQADDLGLRLGLRNDGRYLALPSPLELRMLLRDLQGAPIEPFWDWPAMSLLALFGTSLADVSDAWQSASHVYVGDGCGAVAGLAPGEGELALEPLCARLRPDVRPTFRSWVGHAPAETAAAFMAWQKQLALAATARSSSS